MKAVDFPSEYVAGPGVAGLLDLRPLRRCATGSHQPPPPDPERGGKLKAEDFTFADTAESAGPSPVNSLSLDSGGHNRCGALADCGESPKPPLADARGSVVSVRYRAATVRERFPPQAASRERYSIPYCFIFR